VPAFSLVPDITLTKNLKGLASEIYAIGDCSDPSQIAKAIGSAIRTARSV
jgi:hypothetical protein